MLEIFSSDIRWAQATVKIDERSFGIWLVHEAQTKPIVAKKDEGKEQIIRNGEVYYRYAGRTQKIQFAELEAIINHRVKQNNDQWLDLVKKIGRAGPQNAAILDTERSLIEKDESRILVLDEDLAKKLKFVKQGQFVEKDGDATLRLVGDVVPVDKVEVVQKVREDLLKSYPYTATQLADAIRVVLPSVGRSKVWQAIADNDLKTNLDYAAFIFPNKERQDHYETTGCARNAPSIYNQRAVDFLINVLRTGT